MQLVGEAQAAAVAVAEPAQPQAAQVRAAAARAPPAARRAAARAPRQARRHQPQLLNHQSGFCDCKFDRWR